MDEHKEKIEEVQADDVTSVDTEQKNNKKKIIIISSVVASIVVIALISWFVVTAIDKGKEFVSDVSDSVNNIAENIPSLELDITLQSETTTELETTTEQPTTEEPTMTVKEEIETIDPNADPFTAVVAGSYTDEDYEYYVKIRTYENGAKRYVYHIDSENKDYEFSSIEEMPEAVALDMVEKLEADGSIIIAGVTSTVEPTTTAPKVLTEEEKLARCLEIDKGSYETGYYQKDGVTTYNTRYKDDIVMKAKNRWIKENYGTCFTHNGIEFYWDEANQLYYWIYKYGSIHYMTSTSTSIMGQYYRNLYSFRIADYLGFYGTDFALYHSETALNDEIWELQGSRWDAKMTVDNPYENNLTYLRQLGWVDVVEENGVTKDWSLESPEGVPARICENGDIGIYIKYPGDEREQSYYFTIEEYNDFVKNKSWKVSTRSGSRGLEGTDQANWDKYIRKYLVISE